VATSSSGEAIPELTAREAEVLGLLAEGLTNRQIAQRLYVSAATVKSHVNAICRKLQAENRTHAVAIARRRHLLEA
jgi:DNA-binding NarL/FixJ family response regulator